MRIVGIRAIEGNCIAVNQWLHVANINLEELVKSGLSKLNIKVLGTLVHGGMNGIRDNALYKLSYMFGLSFL